jgi:hypothetical protein
MEAMSMKRTLRRWLVVMAAVSMCTAGCDQNDAAIEPAVDELPEEHPGAAANAPGPAAEPAAEPPGPSVVTDSYELVARTADAYQVGELSQITIELTGRGEWHVNQDFPTRVALTAPPEVKLAKPALDKSDAAEFRDERARFEAPFTAEAAGDHAVTADVAFAICTEDTCIPQRKTLAVTLPVK